MKIYKESDNRKMASSRKIKMIEANIKRFYELSPSSGSKSFYGKAKVAEFDDGSYGLYSYDTLVSTAKDGKVTHLGKYSATTNRHQKEFERQFSESLKEEKTPYAGKESMKESKSRGRKGIRTLKESSGNYNYYEAVKEDVESVLEDDNSEFKELIENASDKSDVYSEIYEILFDDDSVTGNRSGSYTYNREKARQYIKGNLNLLRNALREFGYDPYDKDIIDEYYKIEPEKGDVTIRCYLLGEILDEVLDEYDFSEEE